MVNGVKKCLKDRCVLCKFKDLKVCIFLLFFSCYDSSKFKYEMWNNFAEIIMLLISENLFNWLYFFCSNVLSMFDNKDIIVINRSIFV